MQRLSSGLRINRAADDVAGLGVSELLRAQVRSFTVAARNANDGISLVGIMEGAMSVISDNLVRMRELAQQSANGTLSDVQRSAVQQEFSNLQAEIDRIVDTTEFNSIFAISATGSTVRLQVGVQSGTGNTIDVETMDLHGSALGFAAVAGQETLVGVADSALAFAGSGNFTIQNAATNPTTFTISIPTSGLSLVALRDAINNHANNGGKVTATIIDTGAGLNRYQLQVKANAPGTTSDFNITNIPIALPTEAFAVGLAPNAVAFDGANIWVTNAGDATVTKLRASDGAILGTFNVGVAPEGVVFDGANIWVTNRITDTVTKLRASDGVNLGTFVVANGPNGVAFDGANIWVTNRGSNTVTKLRANDGASLGTFAVGSGPDGVVFDGANIWATNAGDDTVTKLRASDGASLGTFAVGDVPGGVVFDGANIWVTNNLGNSVTKLRASDGASLGTFAVGNAPRAVAFDGTNIWVTNSGSNTVTKLRASDGANLGTFFVGTVPDGVLFDGANIWVATQGDSTVTKLRTLSVDSSASVTFAATDTTAVGTQAAAQAALNRLDSAINQVVQHRGEFGALENRLQTAIASIQVAIEMVSASESRVRDVDVALETANFVRLQILQQAGVSMLAQANQQPSLALELLGGGR